MAFDKGAYLTVVRTHYAGPVWSNGSTVDWTVVLRRRVGTTYEGEHIMRDEYVVPFRTRAAARRYVRQIQESGEVEHVARRRGLTLKILRQRRSRRAA